MATTTPGRAGIPVRLALQVLAAAGSIGAQIGREAAREGATWVLETRRRHRVMNGELPGLMPCSAPEPLRHCCPSPDRRDEHRPRATGPPTDLPGD